jgi:beta-glucanase (GH16 family)
MNLIYIKIINNLKSNKISLPILYSMKKISRTKFNFYSALIFTGAFSFACNTESKETTPTPNPNPPTPVVVKEYKFETTPIWADEFDNGNTPDPSKWSYDIGGGGWGNNELQYYSKNAANAGIKNGVLTIKAIRESISGSAYSSARIVTKGKGDWLYGRFEARAKVPAGKGTWPAFWMLPTDNNYGIWPKSGEIDILEHVGYAPNEINCTVHTDAFNHIKGTQVGVKKTIPTAITEFHIYRVDWTPLAITGYIDDVQYFEFKNSNSSVATWPFDSKFHIILNQAVGGNWGGAQGIDTSAYPASFDIDYVRVYKMVEK